MTQETEHKLGFFYMDARSELLRLINHQGAFKRDDHERLQKIERLLSILINLKKFIKEHKKINEKGGKDKDGGVNRPLCGQPGLACLAGRGHN